MGTSDAYRFEVHSPNGTVRIVERFWEPATCWISDGYDVDAFAADGRYLGATTFLADFRDVTAGALDGAPAAAIFIDGDTIVAVVSDAAGTIMVKRYRLVLPGEG